MLEINLSPLGVSQETASWVGVYVTFGGVVLALLMARLSDLLFGHLKITILLLMLAATVAFVWFLLLTSRHITFSSWQVQTSAALAGSLNYAVSPLFFELGMELGYPAPEDVLGSIMNFAWNTAGVLCLFSMQVTGGMEHCRGVVPLLHAGNWRNGTL
ncbi:Major facilitator superfamily domain, partial [Trinorchestia longiramus]